MFLNRNKKGKIPKGGIIKRFLRRKYFLEDHEDRN